VPEGPYYWIRNGAESPNEMFFDEPTEGLNIDSSKDGKEFDQEFCRLIRVLFREEMPALDRSALPWPPTHNLAVKEECNSSSQSHQDWIV
jgi:hypothetical protein